VYAFSRVAYMFYPSAHTQTRATTSGADRLDCSGATLTRNRSGGHTDESRGEESWSGRSRSKKKDRAVWRVAFRPTTLAFGFAMPETFRTKGARLRRWGSSRLRAGIPFLRPGNPILGHSSPTREHGGPWQGSDQAAVLCSPPPPPEAMTPVQS